MKIIVINKLKEYYDTHKISPTTPESLELEGIPFEWHLNPTDLKLLESYIIDGNNAKIKEIADTITNNQWYTISKIFDLHLFHIVYFTSKEKYHSKGVNVYAIDMMSACEKFTSEFGIDPFYCTVKEKEL